MDVSYYFTDVLLLEEQIGFRNHFVSFSPSTVTSNEVATTELPEPSVAVYVTVVTPIGNWDS